MIIRFPPFSDIRRLKKTHAGEPSGVLGSNGSTCWRRRQSSSQLTRRTRERRFRCRNGRCRCRSVRFGHGGQFTHGLTIAAPLQNRGYDRDYPTRRPGTGRRAPSSASNWRPAAYAETCGKGTRFGPPARDRNAYPAQRLGDAQEKRGPVPMPNLQTFLRIRLLNAQHNPA